MNNADRRDFEFLEKRLSDQREFFERIVQELDKRTELSLSESRRAVDKAENAATKRFESVNEFRQALTDQASEFLPRREYAVAHEPLVNTLNDNTQRLSKLEGRLIGYSSATAIIAIVVAIALKFIS